MHDLLRAYATELAYDVDPEPLRQGVAERMNGYYLRSARAAAVLLDPSQDPPALPGPVPGVTPEHLGGPEAALAWFATEHSTLMAVIRECTDRGRDGQTWRLAWAMEEYLNRRGHSADWITTQQAALAAGERLADLAVQARAHRGLARAYTRLGRHEQAHVHFARALVLFTALDDAAGQAQVLLGTSFAWAGQGEHATAIRPAERALALFTTLGDRRGQAATMNMIGGYLREMGDHELALNYCRRALALNQEVREPRGEADAWDSLGYLYHRRAEYAEAATCYQRALERYRQLGARQYEADTMAKLGETQRVAGGRDAARASWREALALLDELGHAQFVDCDIDEIRAGLQLLDVSEDGRWLTVT
jgi:tetratricopeptide (TPR) repeat protein